MQISRKLIILFFRKQKKISPEFSKLIYVLKLVLFFTTVGKKDHYVTENLCMRNWLSTLTVVSERSIKLLRTKQELYSWLFFELKIHNRICCLLTICNKVKQLSTINGEYWKIQALRSGSVSLLIFLLKLLATTNDNGLIVHKNKEFWDMFCLWLSLLN